MSLSGNELLVFGAGQMRTGTASLKRALEYLYSGKCYHMEEVFKNQSHIALWQKSLDNKKLDKETADIIFKGYCCAVDHPASVFHKDLMELYPNAKVILSVRSPESWIKSVRQTTFKKPLPTFWENIFFNFIGIHLFIKMAMKLISTCFNRSLEELQNDNILRECFIEYNESVKNLIPKERLLIFEAKEGWEPLCKFLNKKIPDVPYPMVNSTNDFQSFLRSTLMHKFAKSIVKVIIPTAIVALSIWYFN